MAKKTTLDHADLSHIAESLRPLAVPVESLTLDPANARHHPEPNLEAIKGSLALYGQLKPIVVRKDTGVVVAGNGTLEAARALGWTHVAAVVEHMSAVEAAGFAITDNRTAELAEWNFEELSHQLRALRDDGVNLNALGWADHELNPLLQAEWTPPSVDESVGGGDEGGKENKGHAIHFNPQQYAVVAQAMREYRQANAGEKVGDAECLARICAGFSAAVVLGVEA